MGYLPEKVVIQVCHGLKSCLFLSMMLCSGANALKWMFSGSFPGWNP
jgi:hypothetical protein